MNLVEQKFGHGAIPKPRDIRDHKASRLGFASMPFDWTKGFDIETTLKIPIENQGQSSSCGGQAGRYYAEVLEALRTGNLERRSAKYIYSHIFYPGGGTTIRDIGKFVVQHGVSEERLVSSYENGNPPSEDFMRDTSTITSEADINAKLAQPFGFAFVNCDIDSVAQAVAENNGAILLVEGQNNGTWLSPFPLPPTQIEWAHFLYAGKVKLINGKKYIGVCNSWGENVGEHGWQWLGEEYFNGGVGDCMVFYDKTLYQYTPTLGQKVFTWLDKFMQWYLKYKH